MDYAYHVFLLLGGIGLFLFGINFMSGGLEAAAGDNLRIFLEKMTKKSYYAVIVGALTTAVIQSSGATMVMVVGFVNAQLMNLAQALYVMLGAAIGTTITAQIIAFNIEPFAPLILFVGMVLYMFIRKRIVKRIGAIILGFGLLFVGIYLMGEAIEAMELGTIVSAFLNNVRNPLLSLLFGFVFTFIIQSSSASVGILQVIVSSSVGAVFGLSSVVYMILGMNIGAVAPVVISALGGNRASRRAAAAEVVTKCLSVLVFIIVITAAPGLLDWIAKLSPSDVSRQIANLHLIFNMTSAVILFPFVKPLASLIMKILPDAPEDERAARKLIYVTSDLSKSPSVMLSQAKKEVMRFAALCTDNFKLAVDCFFKGDEERTDKVFEMEKTINILNHEITSYLVKLYGKDLPGRDVARIGMMFNVTSDLERIADHAENIAEYVQIAKSQHARISPAGLADLHEISRTTIVMLDTAVKAYDTEDFELLSQARDIEDRVDDLQETLIENHIKRLKNEVCEPRGGVIYTDMVSDFERCSDHALNIAEAILGVNAPIED